MYRTIGFRASPQPADDDILCGLTGIADLCEQSGAGRAHLLPADHEAGSGQLPLLGSAFFVALSTHCLLQAVQTNFSATRVADGPALRRRLSTPLFPPDGRSPAPRRARSVR